MADTITNPTGKKFFVLNDQAGSGGDQIAASLDATNAPAPTLSTGNLQATGDKQFVTAAQQTAVATLTNIGTEQLLASVASVNMNTGTATTLYTAPTGKSVVITKVVIRKASTSLTTASISFGWNAGTDNDVIADATHTELTGNTLYTILVAKTGAKVGVQGTNGTFAVICNILQGGAATVTIDVYGYFVS